MIYDNPSLTQLLNLWQQGHQTASDAVLERSYKTLQEISRHLLAGEKFATMQTTDLVNEALSVFLKDKSELDFENRRQFFGLIAHLMRQILIQRARYHNAEKRGGSMRDITFDDKAQLNTIYDTPEVIFMLDLEKALTELEKASPRQAQLTELLYFVGMTQSEAAEILNISRATVERDWRYAKIFLRRHLKQ